MKYLIIKDVYEEDETYTIGVLEKKHLLRAKDRMIEAIINLEEMTYFNHKKNEWIAIVHK